MAYGLLAKVASTVVTDAVGAAAYDLLRWAAAKAPVHEAAVTTTEWGLRGVRSAEKGAESTRLKVADVVAEARERLATVITGYPFLRGALRSLRGGRAVGTDALVSAVVANSSRPIR